jgi:hypothetical protein
MKYLYLFLVSLVPFTSYSQNFDWVKTVGDIRSDFGNRVLTDPQGNIYTFGHAQGTCNFGANTLVSANRFNFIAKYNSNGTNLWAQKIGTFNDVKVTPTGGITLVADNSNSQNVLRLDSLGNTLFSYLIPVNPGNIPVITTVDFDKRGNYIVSGAYNGYSPPLPFFAKFHLNGSVNGGDTAYWNINMLPSDQSTINVSQAIVTPDNGFLVFGQFSNTFTARDIYGDSLVVYASQGVLGTDRLWLKYDSLGYLVWANHASDVNVYSNFQFDSTSNSYYSFYVDGNNNDYATKWDSAGNIVWNKLLYNAGNLPTNFWQPKFKLANDHLYLIGSGVDFTLNTKTSGSLSIRRYDLSGTIMDSLVRPFGFELILGDIGFTGNSIILTGGYDLTVNWGNETLVNNDTIDNFFVAKIALDSLFQSPTIPNGISASNSNLEGLNIFPNPAQDRIEIRFNTVQSDQAQIFITDIIGQMVYSESLSCASGLSSKVINVADLSNGIYSLNVLMSGKLSNKKVVISH